MRLAGNRHRTRSPSQNGAQLTRLGSAASGRQQECPAGSPWPHMALPTAVTEDSSNCPGAALRGSFIHATPHDDSFSYTGACSWKESISCQALMNANNLPSATIEMQGVRRVCARVVGMTESIDRAGLAADLRAVGLTEGRCVLVHASLRRIGPVAGGPVTVLAALRDVLGDAGTVVVPTQTGGNSNTSPAFRARTAGLNPQEATEVEASIAPFHPEHSPSQGMGALAEHVRLHPGALRSRHPQTSFAALGPDAAMVVGVHDLECHLGERSPLGALDAADALVLLLGVGYAACTAFHLAEYRLVGPPAWRPYRCYVLDDAGRRVRRDFQGLDLDDSDFTRIGAAMDALPSVRRGPIGAGTGRLLGLREAVAFAGQWMSGHRSGAPS